VPPFDQQSAAELHARAVRVRWLADHFGHDEAGPRLRAMADELEAEAAALDVAGKNDEATR
jgi:hypothetical protein